jgi:voltage-gated potassium channel
MNKYRIFQKRVYEIIEKGRKGDKASLVFDYSIISIICLNVVAIIVESFESFYSKSGNFFSWLEIISVIIFSVEYLLRMWTARYTLKSKRIFVTELKYVFSPMALIDLLAILPFFLPMIFPFDLRVLRILRLVRLLRILKLTRFTKAMQMVGTVIKEKKEELLVTFFITILLLLVASTVMYYIEHETQPDRFANILTAFWWAIATLTTVGYGDVVPLTGWGKLLSGVIALLGIGLVALPTSILSFGFMEEVGRRKKRETEEVQYCPYCGKKIKK